MIQGGLLKVDCCRVGFPGLSFNNDVLFNFLCVVGVFAYSCGRVVLVTLSYARCWPRQLGCFQFVSPNEISSFLWKAPFWSWILLQRWWLYLLYMFVFQGTLRESHLSCLRSSTLTDLRLDH